MADTKTPTPVMTTANQAPKPPANVPQPAKAVVSAAESLQGKPLFLPDFDAQVKLKNPGLAKRWVNRTTMGGARLSQMQFAGFRIAKQGTDVEVPPYMISADGSIQYMDCILMVIGRDVYEAALKYNAERAVARTVRTDHTKQVSNQLRNELQAAIGNAPPELLNKIRMYAPGAKDTDDME